MLQDHFLSIEPILQDKKGTLRPAFFKKPANYEENDFDPAMCKVELAIYAATVHKNVLTTTPTKNEARFPSSSSSSSTFKHHANNVNDPSSQVKETTFFLCIDGRVFQVDPGQIKDVSVQLDDDNAESGKPPCLLIQFNSFCTFRIFSLMGALADQFSIFNGVKTSFMNFLTSDGNHVSPFPVSYLTFAISPMGSNTHSSSNEPGQKDDLSRRFEGSEEDQFLSDPQKDGKSGSTTTPDKNETALETVTQKCQKSYSQAQAALRSLEYALTLPVESEKELQSSQRTCIDGLLTSVADNVASSFCEKAQLIEAVQVQNKRIQDCHSEMEDIFTAFWPSKRTKTRTQPQTPTNEFITQANQLLEQHKEAVKSKYSLSILPNRG